MQSWSTSGIGVGLSRSYSRSKVHAMSKNITNCLLWLCLAVHPLFSIANETSGTSAHPEKQTDQQEIYKRDRASFAFAGRKRPCSINSKAPCSCCYQPTPAPLANGARERALREPLRETIRAYFEAQGGSRPEESRCNWRYGCCGGYFHDRFRRQRPRIALKRRAD